MQPSRSIKRLLPAIVLLLAFLASALPAHAAPARAQTRKETEEQREFASFVDGFFAGVQRDWAIPGMTFVAVKNGEILYLKSYGVANLETEVPVTPDKTLFRVGSISKPITATALMQLAEKGRVALDEDVNLYLRRWKLSGNITEPVTLRHLLTHTGGFDNKELEVGAPTSADERGYAAKLQKIMPARYAPPGKYYSYSNLGYALIGSIVERYSRQNFPSAVKKHIFQPLAMNRSTFFPTSEDMRDLATGYDRARRSVPYAYRLDMPAVAMSTTASDMGRFMLAQLGGGVLGRNRILSEMFANSMLNRHFSPHPRIQGTGLGYVERNISGLRTLQQAGNMPGYSSFLVLIPEKRFGMFYAANTSGLDFNDDLTAAVIGRFFPEAPGKGAAQPDPPPFRIKPDVEGYYRTNRISRHTAEKATNIMGDQIRVSLQGGALWLTHTKENSPPPEKWIPWGASDEVDGEDLFRLVDENGNPGGSYLFFQRNETGRVTAMTVGDVNHTYDRLEPHESHYWQAVFLFCFFSALVISLLGASLGATINKGKLPWEKGLRAATELWAISSLFCLIQLSFVVGLVLSIFHLGREFVVFVPYQVKALFVIPLAGGLLLAWFWFRFFANLLNPDHHWAEKLTLFLLLLVETGYLLFLADWRLLGFLF